MNRYFTALSLAISTLLLTSCGHVISQDMRGEVTHNLSAARVQEEPDRHLGKKILLGGLILAASSDPEGTTLEILDFRLDSWGEPVSVNEKGVHFLAQSKHPIDPKLYAPGRLVTMVATVIGQDVGPSGPSLQNYPFPRFAIDEIYLWDTPFRYGTLHPNIEAPVYVDPPNALRFSPYDPSFYAYPYTPYWYRP